MKILNTKNGKFGRFMRKNGAFFVLALVIAATCVAIYAGARQMRGSLFKDNSSEINLSGDDNAWQSSQNTQSAQQTDSPSSSLSQSQQRPQSSSSLKPSDSSEGSASQSNSGASQEQLFLLPVANGKVLNKYSGNKPVKSKTMGDWRLHTGADYAAEEGTTVKASGDGVVSKVYTDEMWGTTVEIEHPNSVTTIYSSLAENVFVKKGQKVESGQAIAKVGNTARVELSEASHLHFAVKKNGKYVDPESVITRPIKN
ncbi:MAG: M23 family metallopeptidase [Oscillospiraceae bacterium]|nr:M23 family metallopeptidase [Oscillospiraceae bacterium]